MKARATTTLLASVALAIACGGDDSTSPRPTSPPTAGQPAPPAPKPEPEPENLVEKGRQAYLGNCIACHNPDPTVDGALGPAVDGSSLELLEARVLRAEYPEGYTPKRTTGSMLAMPFLEAQIPALAAYLEAAAK